MRQTRPSFITLIAVIGLALGTAALILTLTIVYGFSRVIESKIALFGAHIQVSHASLKEMPLDTVVLSEISKVPNVAAVSPFLQRSVILKSRAPNGDPLLEPALLKGIVPTEDVSRICEKVVAGAFLSDSAYRSGLPILIGKKLAQRLALSPQSEALVIASATALDASTVLPQSPEALLEQLRLDNAVVVGIYETGLAQGFDEAVVFTTLPALQRFVGAPKRISGYEVRTVEFEQVRQTGNELNQILRPPLMARTIYQLHSAIYAWLSLQKNVVPLLLVMVTIVAAFNVVSTLLIIVLEKSAEIGVLMSFGASPKHIRRIFVSQAFFIALVGIAAGNALALCLSLLEKHFHLIPLPAETYYISETPIFIEPLHYGVVSITALAIALLASLIPAQSASRLKPIDAIRL
ncbi:MAG: ABC transporter permease [Chloroherpetonaceae bacterium]|nr:ABC transporter permease [Chloroherpetonaceae bacterium]